MESTGFTRCSNGVWHQVDLHEFWAYLDVDRTTFSERAFSLFDEDGSGEIDFEEYLLSVYNYATHNKNSLITFAFDLYDLDGSGEIGSLPVVGALPLQERQECVSPWLHHVHRRGGR